MITLYHFFFLTITILILVYMYRVFQGPTVYDRILGLNGNQGHYYVDHFGKPV